MNKKKVKRYLHFVHLYVTCTREVMHAVNLGLAAFEQYGTMKDQRRHALGHR